MRSDAAASASPGGKANAFCDPVNTKSRFHVSVSTGEPAMEVTASTRSSTSSNSFTTSAYPATSCNTPVDVSECTQVTASTGVRRSASRSISGSMAPPSATSRRMHSFPDAPTIPAKRSLKAPLTSESARRRTPLRTAISMNPVTDVVPISTGRFVRARTPSFGAIPCSNFSIPEERCPIIGRSIAARTSG